MAKVDKKKMSEQELERYRRRRTRQGIGAAVIILTIVGLATVLFGGVRGTIRLFDNSKQKAEFEEILTPLVMLDPLPFDSIDKANKDTLKQAVIWSCTYNKDLSVYERDEFGALVLPVVDVDLMAAKLYGPDFEFERETFADSGIEFLYDAEREGFVIPITGQVGNYTPRAVKIKGWNEKTVTIGYISPYAGMMDGSGAKATDEPVKYVDFVFARGRDSYYLIAIRESDMKPEILVESSSEEVSSTTQDPESVLAEQQQAQDEAGGTENNA